MYIYEFYWKTKMLGMMNDLIYPPSSFICEIKIIQQIKSYNWLVVDILPGMIVKERYKCECIFYF